MRACQEMTPDNITDYCSRILVLCNDLARLLSVAPDTVRRVAH